MLLNLLWVLFFLAFPFLNYYLARRVKIWGQIGTVVMAYLIGIALGNLKNLPGLEPVAVDREVANPVIGLALFLAIPLLLMTTNFKQWVRHAGMAGKAFLAACISVMVVGVLAGLVMHEQEHNWQIAGMMVGAATGGTVNLAAVGYSLDIPENLFIIVNTADIAIGGVYLLFMVGPAKAVIGKFLRPYRPLPGEQVGTTRPELPQGAKRFRRGAIALSITLGLTVVSFGLATGIQQLLLTGGMNATLVEELQVPLVVIGLTPLSILVSLDRRIRQLHIAEHLGDYFILVFAVSFGALVDIKAFQVENLNVLFYAISVVFFSILLYYPLCRLLKIDTDTAIIISAAAVFSPPLISPVAEALKNRQALISGLTTGIVGYAIGTFLGLAVAFTLRYLL